MKCDRCGNDMSKLPWDDGNISMCEGCGTFRNKKANKTTYPYALVVITGKTTCHYFPVLKEEYLENFRFNKKNAILKKWNPEDKTIIVTRL